MHPDPAMGVIAWPSGMARSGTPGRSGAEAAADRDWYLSSTGMVDTALAELDALEESASCSRRALCCHARHATQGRQEDRVRVEPRGS